MSPPEFKTSFFFHQESATGSIVLTFQQPGIYYYGGRPSFEGRPMQSTAGGMFDGAPSTHPTALVVTGPSGEVGVNQSIPAGFAGEVVHLARLKTSHQFCITEHNLTAFAGCQIRLPLCRPELPGAEGEIPPQPSFVSVVSPSWLAVLPLNNATCRTCTNDAYWAFLNSTQALGSGRTRYTLRKGAPGHKGRWATYNNFVPLFVTFDKSHITEPNQEPVQLSVMIHDAASDAMTVPVTEWQTLRLRVVATPSAPLPKRLITSLTWSDESLLLDDSSSDGFLSRYRQLGFNTVPLVSMPAQFGHHWSVLNESLGPVSPLAPASLLPAGRTGADWSGLLFGPQLSEPSISGGATACTQMPKASLLPPGLSAAQITIEMEKWKNAYDFHESTRALDVAYDGIFSRSQARYFCALMSAVQPDWIFLDDEAFGAGWESWRTQVVSF